MESAVEKEEKLEICGLVLYDLFPYMTVNQGTLTDKGGVTVAPGYAYGPCFAVLPKKAYEPLNSKMEELAYEHRRAKQALDRDFCKKRDAVLSEYGIEHPRREK